MSAHNEPLLDDPFLWLEDIDGPKAMEWVKARNAEAVTALASTPEFKRIETGIREVLDSDQRIPFVEERGGYLYNLWEDREHPRGQWRRTTLAEYRKDQPAWEVLLDLDALGKAEGESWVWAGVDSLPPDHRRCLVALSRGGADATVVREFDLVERRFVEGGFTLPEAKQSVSWMTPDALFVASDFGLGTMTTSGYPRTVRLWKRGPPLAQAEVVYEGQPDDLTVGAGRDFTPGFERDWVIRTLAFYRSHTFLRATDATLTRIDVPEDAEPSAHREWLLIRLRTDWTVAGRTFRGGSLLAASFDGYLAGKRELTVLFEPTASTSLIGARWTKHHLLLNTLRDVAGEVEVLTPAPGAWHREPLGDAPALSTVEAWGTDPLTSDDFWLRTAGFLSPTTLARGSIGKEPAAKLKQLPHFFDASRFEVSQSFATSVDGTRVPYFLISRTGAAADGQRPTLLYGYGGFEVSLQPEYYASVGRAWLEPGGSYVIANIRGGGEYGPAWHQAALKQNRSRSYQDFAAVARDLIARGLTSPQHLVAQGGSNGGLLMGNMLTQYPELFAGILCEVALLDMRRYTKLSAGASWVAEYGDPDRPEEWEFIRTFSPYENVKRGAAYPKLLLTTSTRDDRVGPVHARKMAARMNELGHPAQFYENIEGGHGAASDHAQKAFMSALGYAFLWRAAQ